MGSSLTPLILSHSTFYPSGNLVNFSCKIYSKFDHFSLFPPLLPQPKPPVSRLDHHNDLLTGFSTSSFALLQSVPTKKSEWFYQSDHTIYILKRVTDVLKILQWFLITTHSKDQSGLQCPALWLLFFSLSSSFCYCHTGLLWSPCGLTLTLSRSCSNVGFSLVKSSLTTLFKTDPCLLPGYLLLLYFSLLLLSSFYALHIFLWNVCFICLFMFIVSTVPRIVLDM